MAGMQVSVHLRLTNKEGEVTLASECFECQPKAAPKSFPVCTIRNTPDKPIHCVVWAKDLLFQRLFGRQASGFALCLLSNMSRVGGGRFY